AQAATDTLDQSQTLTISLQHLPQMAQTFTAGTSGRVDRVSLASDTFSGAVSLTVEIDGVGANGAPNGTALGSTTFVGRLTCCKQFHDFGFSPGVPVVAGSHYAIVVRSIGVFTWYDSWAIDGYLGGQLYVACDGCAWLTGSSFGRDFAFKTWVAGQGAALPPTLTTSQPVVSVNEGTAASQSGTFADPNGSAVTLTADAGTVAAASSSGGSWSWTEAAGDESPGQVVTVTATDALGLSNSATFTVDVAGVSPSATITSDPPTSPEGSVVPLTGAGTSPDAADNAAGFRLSWTVTKDGSPFASGSGAAWSYTTADEGTYVITFQVTDDGGMTGSTTLSIVGTDVTPAAKIAGVSSPALVTTPNEPLSFHGSFADSGNMDSHTATWDFGDGTTSTTSIPVGGSTSLSATHSYAAAGTYAVTLKVKDDDGTLGQTTAQVSVQTTQQALGTLSAYLQSLSGLNKGQKNSLTIRLDAASASAARGDNTAAHNQLNAFANEVNAYANAGKLSPAQASTLRNAAHAIQAALGTYNRFLEWALEL
ncbi:MAG TPA: PKD domain-containing protein, partial [Candidatus Dormibacteraeota bacterium]|nr:PKD domain-containing protein [Candidatus Dormibacteraeota bacterium]